ncbi:hypothetical protein EB077_07915 [bacterium]|nr:hypothetical protein [bacterium]
MATVTPGATAGTNIVDNFTIIDTHDHSSGKGVQIPTAGLNINAALSFGNQKAYNLLCTQFTSQTSSPTSAGDRPNVHVLNGDLYYVNSSGTAVQITNAGSISGASGSIGGLASPASAQFATNTFTWKATATDYAKFALSEINIFPFTTSPANALTLKVSNSVTAYTITFPDAPPASTQPLGMTSGGLVSALTYDSIGTNMTSVGANAIAISRTRATGTTVASGGVAISSSSGTFATTSITNVDVTNLSVTITSSGRPIFIGLVPDNLANISQLNLRRNGATTGSAQGQFYLLKDGLTMFQYQLVVPAEAIVSGSNDTVGFTELPGAFSTIDFTAAGTYIYKMQVNLAAATSQIRVLNCKLVAFEL